MIALIQKANVVWGSWPYKDDLPTCLHTKGQKRAEETEAEKLS